MPYIYLILSVFLSASFSVFGKLFNKMSDGLKATGAFYNFFILLSVFAGWGAMYATSFSFDIGVLVYSLGFAAFYTVCIIGNINALKHGSAPLTSLFISMSLIVTTIWGFLFWGAAVTVLVITGLILVAISIYFCLCAGNKRDETRISWKWLFFAVLALVGNAGCSIVQRAQQLQYHGEHGNMMMFFASGFSLVAFFILYLRSDKSDTKTLLRRNWFSPVCAGVCNVALNFFVIKMATTELSPSLIYPVIGVGSLMVVIVFSLFLFKEKMNRFQWIGIAIGSVAVALLSI